MPLNGFAPSGFAELVPTNVSSSVALPGTPAVDGSPATALVTNTGSSVAYIVLGVAGVTVNGPALALLPGKSIPLTIGATNTELAATGQGAVLNIAVGT
jgi:hypothetical protein